MISIDESAACTGWLKSVCALLFLDSFACVTGAEVGIARNELVYIWFSKYVEHHLLLICTKNIYDHSYKKSI